MKKILVCLMITLFAGIQSFGAPRIILEDNKENYTQTEKGYMLFFKLSATSEELSGIAKQAGMLSDELKINFSEGSNNLVDCIFEVLQADNVQSIYDLLNAIGIYDLEYKGKVQKLETIVEIVQSYL